MTVNATVNHPKIIRIDKRLTQRQNEDLTMILRRCQSKAPRVPKKSFVIYKRLEKGPQSESAEVCKEAIKVKANVQI